MPSSKTEQPAKVRETMTTPFHRVRFVLRATRDIRIPGQQGGMLYALLCDSNRREATGSAYPADFLLDAPEQTRSLIRNGERFAFGGTLLAPRSDATTEVLARLVDGLRQSGLQGKPRSHGLGGNYCLEAVEDIVAGRSWNQGTLTTIPLEQLNSELLRLEHCRQVTLRFWSPLRLERPRGSREKRRTYFDDRYFDSVGFGKKLLRRLSVLGIRLRDEQTDSPITPESIRVVSNRLLWLDMSYGGPGGTILGGLVGHLTLEIQDPIAMAALVWGQYSRLGKNTSFGFGRYRIEELGPEPFECRRAISLLDVAWTHPSIDRLTANAHLESGVLGQAIDEIRRGSYQPHPHARVLIGEGDKQRELRIPSRRDRVLQRLVLETIAPGLDRLFEASSFAWRKGLGRHSSARVIARAYRDGYQFAVNADFDRFFDSIEHELVETRLAAYLADDETTHLIMRWIQAGIGNQNQGLPTGAPLSPLLGNLVLDRFDELIAARGGRLVRYGDDFLILCREESQARELLVVAWDEACRLALTLNEQPQEVVDLDEGFTFLGFRFEKTERWQATGSAQPRRVEELGWHDASRSVPKAFSLVLMGETGQPASDFGLTAIVGPGATHLEPQPEVLRCHYQGGRATTSIPLADLETLIVLGRIGISTDVVERLTARQVHVVLADDRGESFASIAGDYDLSAELLVRQVEFWREDALRLEIARSIVVSKIHNYGRLAAAMSEKLPELAGNAQRLAEAAGRSATVEHLRGIEGAAAAQWYGTLTKTLGSGFTFERRVAPDADDPVNVLLNIAQTMLYRLTILAIRSAGMSPSLGFFHVPTGRFCSLASDLQEPFRFLMDRAAIQATHELRPRDFRRVTDGPFRLSILPEATRKFQLLLWRTLHLAVNQAETGEPVSYLVQIQRQARQLRRHLLNVTAPFQAFRLP